MLEKKKQYVAENGGTKLTTCLCFDWFNDIISFFFFPSFSLSVGWWRRFAKRKCPSMSIFWGHILIYLDFLYIPVVDSHLFVA